MNEGSDDFEPIPPINKVFEAYTVGFAASLTSNLGTTITGSDYFGLIAPSHVTS